MSRNWQELDQQATEGPWVTLATMPTTEGRTTVMVCHEVGDGTFGLAEMYDDGSRSQYDAEFIAAARIAWPAAERECEQLRALLRQVRESLHKPGSLGGEARDLIDSSSLLADEGQQQ